MKTYEEFERIVLAEVDKVAPIKTKKIRANDKPFMTKKIRKAIMTTSRLETKYRKEKTDASKAAYKKQNNYTNKLCTKEKRKFRENLDLSDRKQVKQFWKTLGPFFMDKGNNSPITTIVHGEKIITIIRKLRIHSTSFLKKL